MGVYENLDLLIRENIKPNGNQEITGQILQETLLEMIETQGQPQEEMWVALRALTRTRSLIPGRLYRINDYVTTTKQENTQSAGHPFDLVVLALSESTLSEQAWAVKSARDTDRYFANSNLSAWKIWYCLENDTNRFAWADDTNGKGVIYRMIDEFNNDIPYDFKNIQFVRYKLNAPDEYTPESPESPEEAWVVQLSKNIRAQFSSGQSAYIYAGIENGDKYWEEEYSVVYSSATGETKAFYTFHSTTNDTDSSLSENCHDNKMMFSKDLPNNVFFGNSCYSNSFGNSCNSNSFGNDCNSNSFGNSCYNNSFGNYCRYNKADDGVSVILNNSETASSNQQIQNYHLTLGLTSKTIEVERNRAYQTTVAIDSSGNVKQFCIADIIL